MTDRNNWTPTIACECAIEALESLLSLTPIPEKLILMPGWGAITKWLSTGNLTSKPDEQRHDKLMGLLQRLKEAGIETDLTDVAVLTTNAYDTPPWVASLVAKDLATEFAHVKGRIPILFPSCGTGTIAWEIKEGHPALYHRLDITAVDTDPVRAKIFSIIHPQATVINDDFITWAKGIPEDQFYCVVDNVPFGGVIIDDRPLHCAFLKQMIRLCVKGGAIGYITSTGFLNSVGNMAYRLEANSLCDLVKYVPIPQGACSREGTGTAIDYLLFTKK